MLSTARINKKNLGARTLVKATHTHTHTHTGESHAHAHAPCKHFFFAAIFEVQRKTTQAHVPAQLLNKIGSKQPEKIAAEAELYFNLQFLAKT